MKNLFIAALIFSFAFAKAQTSLPEISLKNLDGKEISLANLSDDKTVVVSLWATWCVPCIRELDTIAEVYEEMQEEINFELVAISVDDSRSTRRVKPAVMGKGWEYTVLLDPNNDVRRHLGNPNVPLTLIIKNGEIVYRHSSFTPGAEDELFEKFKEIAG
ncbi:thiol:disulfide interchange protein [Nonlabens arenilitoris]|uniref:Thiol:disulfide interchange protein n=1 Tax=Nonlabens arenilitoris TaxID=1217969 RepID=A0A2S7U7V5_9FLAO|nr:TlpA disulfide reductase family protein [Nonlabens arenilitoris]PQJ31056.1 thiol:disulfide interchange protein [Nonlabens arenilitoris]